MPPSDSLTWVTTYRLNQSITGPVAAGGIHQAGKHRNVFLSGLAGIFPPLTQSFAEYVIETTPPVSLTIDETRNRMIGSWEPSTSTRLLIGTPLNVRSGSVAVPPARPAWLSVFRNIVLALPSPGSSHCWPSVHCSTFR